MNQVPAHELRDSCYGVLQRVESGEVVTITRDGAPVARMSPVPAPRLSAAALIERWKNIPVIDAAALRDDMDF